MARTREQIVVRGIVQGVGFRPFVYRLAMEYGLAGYVLNNGAGVEISVEGDDDAVASFENDLVRLAPPISHIVEKTSVKTPLQGGDTFVIKKTEKGEERTALITPDCDVCDDCLHEMFEPGGRRYRYPFINCTNCGPRYSIITSIPYDRPKTTMAKFIMCDECREEYEDPADRRFHAQPIACPRCGPALAFRGKMFALIDTEDPLREAVKRIAEGSIVAIKGIGGFHLAVDAEREEAVMRLRERKMRDEKPFAVMFPSLAIARNYARIGKREEALLESSQRPIVLACKGNKASLPSVAPSNRRLGVMLPYTPIHHLLFKEGRFNALVMTSANISDDPIVHTESGAKERLIGIADYFLTHNRPIEHRSDDSIELCMSHGPVILRRSRGYTPTPIRLDRSYPPTLAMGGDLKNTFCFIKDDRAFLSQHIGDLKYEASLSYLESSIDSFLELIDAGEPEIVAFDMHPDSAAARVAKELYAGKELVAIQHHHAHLVSLVAEKGALDEKAIGIIFDGTGYGDDGAIWGGEFLLGGAEGYRRLCTTRPLALPGGDAAIKEPWRIALALLDEMYGDNTPRLNAGWMNDIHEEKRRMVVMMARNKINTPFSHGAGRLFDAAAALMGLRSRVTYEGQAAMALEAAVAQSVDESYHAKLAAKEGCAVLDFIPVFKELIDDLLAHVPQGVIAARFHNSVADGALQAARMIRKNHGVAHAALSGGVFQNRYLSDRLGRMLENDGFELLRHSRIPPNDGGISLGQAVAAARFMENGVHS